MRLRWIIALLIVAVVAGWSWPYAGAYTLAQAAARGDKDAVAAQIDFPALRHSFARQIVRTYLVQSGRNEKLSGLGRSAAMALGTTVADPYLKDLLTPDTITALLGQGRLTAVKFDNRSLTLDQPVPSFPAMLNGRLAAVLLHSYYDGIGRFVFNLEEPATGNSLAVHLGLSGLTWRLAGIDLPQTVLDRIVADILARQKADARS